MIMVLLKFGIHYLLESDPGPDVEIQSDNMRRKYCFAIRDEPGALAKALLVFNVKTFIILS